MRGNSFGKLFSLTSFGESHGEAVGVVIDGMPSNIEFSMSNLQKELDRRAPGRDQATSSRNEPDRPEILSGIFEGKTLGTPICVVVKNVDKKSSHYNDIKDVYRVGHADETTMIKYGIRDYRGGGRASGRETVSRVIAGYFAGLILQKNSKVEIDSKIIQLGDWQENQQEMDDYLQKCKELGKSVGGSILLKIKGCPSGLGEPCFDKLKADLAKSMLSIGGCVGFSYGDDNLSIMTGEQMIASRDNLGGIEGGISTGLDITLKLSFKAPATFGEIAKMGRHDPSIVPRVIPVVEAMAKIVLADHLLRQKAYD